MKKRNRLGKRNFILLMLGIGIAGAVLFFPVNIQNRYTCLYHRLLFPEHSYSHSHKAAEHPENQVSRDSLYDHLHDQLLRGYLKPFGLLWWGSLLIVTLCFYELKKLSGIGTDNRPMNRSVHDTQLEEWEIPDGVNQPDTDKQ